MAANEAGAKACAAANRPPGLGDQEYAKFARYCKTVRTWQLRQDKAPPAAERPAPAPEPAQRPTEGATPAHEETPLEYYARVMAELEQDIAEARRSGHGNVKDKLVRTQMQAREAYDALRAGQAEEDPLDAMGADELIEHLAELIEDQQTPRLLVEEIQRACERRLGPGLRLVEG